MYQFRCVAVIVMAVVMIQSVRFVHAQTGGRVIPIGESRPGTIEIGESRSGTIKLERDESLEARHRDVFPEDIWKLGESTQAPDRVRLMDKTDTVSGVSASHAHDIPVVTVDVSVVSTSIVDSAGGKMEVGIIRKRGYIHFLVFNGVQRLWKCSNSLEIEGRLAWFDSERCVIVTPYDTQEIVPRKMLSEPDQDAIRFTEDACRKVVKDLPDS